LPKPRIKSALERFTLSQMNGPSGRRVVHVEEAITTQMIYPGITMDPGVRFGKPCVAGTRVDVATVVGAIGAGDTVEAVQEAYDLSRDQVLAAVRYAAHVAAHLPPAVQEVS